MSSGHSHSAAGAGASRLKIVLLLTGGYMLVEVVGGILTGSLALIADAGHMLTDVAGVSMALLAIRFAARPANDGKSFGYFRLEILAAIANGILLFVVAAYILYEAYRRFLGPPEVLGLPMFAVASVGLLVNLVSARLLFGSSKSSLNMRGAFYEVVGDLLSSVAVIVAGVAITLTGLERRRPHRLGPDRSVHSAPDVDPDPGRGRRPPRGDAEGHRHGRGAPAHPRDRRPSATPTTSTPRRSPAA